MSLKEITVNCHLRFYSEYGSIRGRKKTVERFSSALTTLKWLNTASTSTIQHKQLRFVKLCETLILPLNLRVINFLLTIILF